MVGVEIHCCKGPLTLILLTWRIGCATNNASKWQMGFKLAFKGLNSFHQIFYGLKIWIISWNQNFSKHAIKMAVAAV
jgi:hypothetical protein